MGLAQWQAKVRQVPPREKIQCFSKKRKELPNITNADIINAFTYGTTCEALVHALEREAPRMTQDLLDVTTKYTMREEAILETLAVNARPVLTIIVVVTTMMRLPWLATATIRRRRTRSTVGRRWLLRARS